LVGLMRSRDEYFVLRRSAAYAGQSPFAGPVGPARIAPSCATRGQHQIRNTTQIDAQRARRVMKSPFAEVDAGRSESIPRPDPLGCNRRGCADLVILDISVPSCFLIVGHPEVTFGPQMLSKKFPTPVES